MSAESAVYHYRSCNGKIANPITPNCAATSPGAYGTPEDGILAAKTAGWSQVGTKDYCPGCSAGHTPVLETEKVKTPRPRKQATPEPAEQSTEHHE